jgi:hypothetical protein
MTVSKASRLRLVERAAAACIGEPSTATADRSTQPSPDAKRQDLHEQRLQTLAVTAQEPRDGGMVNLLIACDDPAAHIIEAGRLDLARRAHALAVAVQHQAQ